MIRAFANSLRPKSMPLMTRQSYYYELLSSLLLPVSLSMVESGVVGIVAAKVFGVGDFQLSAIVAAPMFGNITSFGWAILARGRRKIAAIIVLQVWLLASIAVVAVLPLGPAGGWALTAVVILSRCIISGIITLRSAVLRMNYPRRLRGRIAGRLSMVTSVIMMAAPLVGGALLDHNPDSFRMVYAVGAVLGLGGVLPFSKVRLRGEKALLRFERTPAARPVAHGEAGRIYEYHPGAPRVSVWTVLRNDPRFRRYMFWQFLNGASNMIMGPALILFVTESMKAGFMLSMLLVQILPGLTAVISLPLWAPFLDRVHITHFRSRLSLVWTASQLLTWLAAMSGHDASAAVVIAVMAAARLVLGIGQGGGTLAWDLGHNDFASRELVAVYMGIHVTLTGIRGAIAPFVGTALYVGWSAHSIPGTSLSLPAFAGIGGHLFVIAAFMSAWSAWGFYSMYRAMTAESRRPADG